MWTANMHLTQATTSIAVCRVVIDQQAQLFFNGFHSSGVGFRVKGQ